MVNARTGRGMTVDLDDFKVPKLLSSGFPIGESMSLSTSGISVSSVPDELKVVLGEKPHVVIGAPEQLHIYIPPYRYVENNMWAHMEDLWQSVAIRANPNAARMVVNNKLGSEQQPMLKSVIQFLTCSKFSLSYCFLTVSHVRERCSWK